MIKDTGPNGGMKQETRDKRQETRDKKQESRDKKQETRDKKQDGAGETRNKKTGTGHQE